jgi:hypothetical protein
MLSTAHFVSAFFGSRTSYIIPKPIATVAFVDDSGLNKRISDLNNQNSTTHELRAPSWDFHITIPAHISHEPRLISWFLDLHHEVKV